MPLVPNVGATASVTSGQPDERDFNLKMHVYKILQTIDRYKSDTLSAEELPLYNVLVKLFQRVEKNKEGKYSFTLNYKDQSVKISGNNNNIKVGLPDSNADRLTLHTPFKAFQTKLPTVTPVDEVELPTELDNKITSPKVVILMMDETIQSEEIIQQLRLEAPDALYFCYNQVARDNLSADMQSSCLETCKDCLHGSGADTKLIIVSAGESRTDVDKIYGQTSEALAGYLQWCGLTKCGDIIIKTDYIGKNEFLDNMGDSMCERGIEFKSISGPTDKISVSDIRLSTLRRLANAVKNHEMPIYKAVSGMMVCGIMTNGFLYKSSEKRTGIEGEEDKNWFMMRSLLITIAGGALILTISCITAYAKPESIKIIKGNVEDS